ncbi:MAG: CHAT domain-containing protein, partial [Terriglobia bacterium]
LDLLGAKAQLSRSKGGLLEEERTLQERIAAIKARLSGEGDGELNRGRLGKELAAAEQAYNAFLAKVRSQDKEQASLMSVEPLTLKQVQDLLDPGQSLLEYFVTESEVFIWVVEKDKLNFQRVALPKSELAKAVKNLRENIATLGDPQELREVSTALYRQLIEPVLSQIGGKELIIVPHDVLHYLPFQALLGSDGRYLIEKYPINYLSSASLLQFTKEKSRAMGERLLALGNPDLGDPKMNLEFAEIETKEIKSLYPQSTIYLEKEATEEKAKTLSPQNDIIHFASHAELNEDDPLSSAILLAKSDKEDGRLEVREIFGMDLKASLVVLSACETGLGKLSSGDELVGLTRAFIYAGTPSVVASLWNVEDSSTAQLIASFYKNLKTMTKVEALPQAQLQLIRGNVNSDLLARRGIGGVGKLGETPAAKSPPQDSATMSISTSHPYF